VLLRLSFVYSGCFDCERFESSALVGCYDAVAWCAPLGAAARILLLCVDGVYGVGVWLGLLSFGSIQLVVVLRAHSFVRYTLSVLFVRFQN